MDFLGDGAPIDLPGLPLGIAFGQVHAEVVADSADEVVAFGLEFASLEFAFVDALLEFVDLGLDGPGVA